VESQYEKPCGSYGSSCGDGWNQNLRKKMKEMEI